MGTAQGQSGRSALELAWARHEGGAAEAGPGLSVGRVVAAAIGIADADGLAAVSMARVATSLGFTTMSLYRHVRSKSELVLLMQDDAIGPPPPGLTDLDAEPAAGPHPRAVVAGVAGADAPEWRRRIARWAWAVLAGFRAHPWLLETIQVTGPPATPNQLSWLEQGLRAVRGTGLTPAEALNTILLIDAHVFSDLQFDAAGEATAGEADYVGTLVAVLDPERFPAVLEVFRGGALDGAGEREADRDTAFAYGLARILDGVQALVDRRAAG